MLMGHLILRKGVLGAQRSYDKALLVVLHVVNRKGKSRVAPSSIVTLRGSEPISTSVVAF